MHHAKERLQPPTQEVFDVAASCRSQKIDKHEAEKIARLVGRFASRFEIQMNLKKRPPRFR